MPDEIRLHPRALSACRRAAGRAPADAPLVEAPAFMAPPPERRNLLVHYVPRSKTIAELAGAILRKSLALASLRRS